FLALLFHDDLCEFFGNRGEHLASVSSDQTIVFDADAAPTFQIDSRLDRNDHAGLKWGFRRRAESRPLVNVQTNAMAQTVAEMLAETGIFHHPSGDGIHVAAPGPGSDRPDGRLLCF